MAIIVSIALFALGTVVASFVGVVVARLNTGQGFVFGRSHCDACNKPLPPSALVPVISYVASRGRSRCCGAFLSPVSPLTELLLGGLFAITYHALGFSFALLSFLLSLSLLLSLVLYDLMHQILPPPLLAIFVAMCAVTCLLLEPNFSALLDTFLVALSIALFLALIHVFSRGRAMGLSDAPLAFGLALLVGPAAFSGFIFSFWIGAVIGIVILFSRPRGSRIGVEVPFAPFLAAGFLLAYYTQWNIFTIAAALH